MALSHPHWTEMHEAYSIRSSLASNRGTIRLSQPPARTKMPRFMLKAGLDTPLQAGIIWSGSGPRGGERVFWGWGVELGGRGRGGGERRTGTCPPRRECRRLPYLRPQTCRRLQARPQDACCSRLKQSVCRLGNCSTVGSSAGDQRSLEPSSRSRSKRAPFFAIKCSGRLPAAPQAAHGLLTSVSPKDAQLLRLEQFLWSFRVQGFSREVP